ncbi:MAG TPA: hypothetical protein VFN22_07015 [Gemmatimonadales bacterium]|nr:hypothetical protein [Gemmatimonadales bacterium]
MRPIVLALVLTVPCVLPAQQPAGPPPPACTSAPFRAFDYWVGEWTVTDSTGRQIAESSITSVSAGCAIHEHWRPLRGTEGHSLSWYDSRDSAWHQQWIDGGGWIARFDGGMDGAVMQLTEVPSGDRPISRMRYEKRAGGVVRQSLWQSKDGGATWVLGFVGDYAPKP